MNNTKTTTTSSIPFHEPYTISNNEHVGMTQLHLNENLFVDSELFIADSCRYSKGEQINNGLHLYPPSGNRIICEAAAEVFGFSVDEVFPAAGASHVLSLLLLRFASIYRKIILPSPTWGYYRSCAKSLDITVVDVQMKVEDKQFVYDIATLDSALVSNGPAILLLSTPNNPTGNIIDYQDIGKLASSNPTSIVIVDESYFGFVDIDPCAASTLVHAHDNIVIVRSLSKAYGLAGLRVGFALATGVAKNAINNFFLPFGLPKYVQEIAADRLKDTRLLQKVRIACTAGYDALVSGLTENYSITAYRSNANFCLINVPPGTAKNYINQLEINGYLVKYHSDSHIRITIAKSQTMVHVASILNKGIEKSKLRSPIPKRLIVAVRKRIPDIMIKYAETDDEFERIYRLNHETYAIELGQEHVTENGRLLDKLQDRCDYLIAKKEDKIVGMAAITRPGNVFSIESSLEDTGIVARVRKDACEFRRVAIIPEYRNQGLYVLLIESMAQYCIKNNISYAFTSAIVDNVGLYEKAGFYSFDNQFSKGRATYQPMMGAMPGVCDTILRSHVKNAKVRF